MKCPTDSTTLVISERGGVEIDCCPECRGVWLDRGELDKIIARAEAEFAAIAPAQRAPVAPPGQYEGDRGRAQFGNRDRGHDDDRHRGYDNRDTYRGKKRESRLGDLFG